jgi:hypothetical protein
MFRLGWSALGLLLWGLGGCGPSAPDRRPLRWAYVHPAIIVPSCATSGCHSAAAVAGGRSFESERDSLRTLLADQFVQPGNPHSPLLYVLEGTERRRMPPDAPLPAADVELIRAWVEEGAPP